MVRVVHSIRSRKFGHNIFLKKSTPDSSDPNIDEAANNLAEASLQIQNVYTIVAIVVNLLHTASNILSIEC